MDIAFDRNSTVPVYRQIAEQIKTHISAGRLPAESRLPTVRRLATELGVTRLTVQNAYAELQSAGWTESTVGRGTFVAAHTRPQIMRHRPEVNLTPDGYINDLLQVGNAVGLRSLASASPDPRLFPVEEFATHISTDPAEAASVWQYAASEGDPALRVQIAEYLADRGLRVDPDEVLVVAGVTQGLSLVTQILCRPGDTVLVEDPTYLGMLHTLRSYGVQPLGVPLDACGALDLDQVEQLVIQTRPRFLYLVPTYQNPGGTSLPVEQRHALLALAEKHGFLIVEDDIYARLTYAEEIPPALHALDSGDNVVHVGSFSKLLSPGLRLGYVIAPSSLHSRLASLRRAIDLCSPPLLQRALAGYLRSDGPKRHLRRVLPLYRQRRDTLLNALDRTMPDGATWTEPRGGLCVWLTLPPRGNFADLHHACVQKGFAFSPGEVFMAQPQAGRHLRICFGEPTPETINAAVDTLAALVRERLDTGIYPIPAGWRPLV
ncbi:MAG: PLP-dependent aminotransferase family protein [Litorilinea sp.]